MSIAGTEMHAKNAIPTGAPTRVPSCHNNFFFLDHGFLPQKVQPKEINKNFKKHVGGIEKKS